MNNSLFNLIFLLPLFCYAQIGGLPYKDERINFNEVVPVESVDTEALYRRAKIWTAEMLKSHDHYLKLDDHKMNVIVVESYFSIITSKNFNEEINFTLKIEIRDKRYRYEVTQFLINNDPLENTFFDKSKFYNKKGEPRKNSDLFKSKFMIEVNTIINSLKTAMDKEESKTDW